MKNLFLAFAMSLTAVPAFAAKGGLPIICTYTMDPNGGGWGGAIAGQFHDRTTFWISGKPDCAALAPSETGLFIGQFSVSQADLFYLEGVNDDRGNIVIYRLDGGLNEIAKIPTGVYYQQARVALEPGNYVLTIENQDIWGGWSSAAASLSGSDGSVVINTNPSDQWSVHYFGPTTKSLDVLKSSLGY